MTRKTAQLSAATVDRLKHLASSGPDPLGRVTLTYLDPSAPHPQGHGMHYEVTLDGIELVEFSIRRATPESPRLTRTLVRNAPVEAIAGTREGDREVRAVAGHPRGHDAA